MSNKLNEEILKEFEKEFGLEYPFDNPLSLTNRTKDFLLSTITKVREDERKDYEAKVVEIIKRELKIKHSVGYHWALIDLQTELKEKNND